MAELTEDEVDSAIAEAVGTLVSRIDPGAIATRYAVLVEVIDTAGQVGLWTLTHAGAKPWDVLGLLDFARAREYAATAREDADDDD